MQLMKPLKNITSIATDMYVHLHCILKGLTRHNCQLGICVQNPRFREWLGLEETLKII